jgi:hypothetical protein
MEWRRLSPERARLVWRVEGATEGDWGLAAFDGTGLVAELGQLGAVPTYERRPGEVFAEERALAFSDERTLELRLFDFLELDRRGLTLADVIAERLGVPGR